MKTHNGGAWADETEVIDNLVPVSFDCADVSTFLERQRMKIEEMKQKEAEVSKAINEARDIWVERYGFAPDVRMSCFQVVELLEKLGLLKDD